MEEKNIKMEHEVRKEKLEKIRENKVPYVDRFARTHTLESATKLGEGEHVSVCGRIVFKRDFGKFMFMKLRDLRGDLQVSISFKEVGEEDYSFAKQFLDIGDFLGLSGVLYRTKTGELTVSIAEYKLLSKALHPLPEKWHGIQDVDAKFRQRYLDLISTEETRKVFLTRSRVISFLRDFLNRNDFLEVETPTLQNVASGAAARPFVTKHNALDKDFYLRIAPELFLKQTIAGGFDRVYEIGKNFRNEGMDASHLQEFTMLEWYAAYWDYEDNIAFSHELIKELLISLFGSTKIEFNGNVLDFGKEWEKLNYCEELSKLIQRNILDFNDVNELKDVVTKYELLPKESLEKANSIPSLIDLLYKRRIRPYIIKPTVLYNYPASLIPLARRNDKDPRVIDMFQLVVCGWEIIKAYSELIDPVVQKQTFIEQMANKNAGDDEAFEIDYDFLLAMEHGMPPMSGLGLGVDRLVAILCNQSTLRDVVLYPQMK